MKMFCRCCLLADREISKLDPGISEIFVKICGDEFQIGEFSLGLCLSCKFRLLGCWRFNQQCRNATETLRSLIGNCLGNVEETCNAHRVRDGLGIWSLFNIECVDNGETNVRDDRLGIAVEECSEVTTAEVDIETENDSYYSELESGSGESTDALDILRQDLIVEGAKTLNKVNKPTDSEPVRGRKKCHQEIGGRRLKGKEAEFPLDKTKIHIITQSVEEIMEELQSFRESERYVEAPYKCEPCAKYFITEDSFTEHSKRHSETDGPVACDICTQRYKTLVSLVRHKETHVHRFRCVCVNTGKEVSYSKTKSCKDGKEYTVGEVCGRVFLNRSGAVKHLAMHAGQKLYMCAVCGKTTHSHDNYLKHNRTHRDAKKHVCSQCGKLFSSSTAKNMHMMSAHSQERHFACASCPMTFVSRAALNAHATKHSSDHQFYCIECDKHFKTLSMLKAHLTTAKHVDPQDYPYQCSVCNKHFPTVQRLTNHSESVHVQSGSFPCTLCDTVCHTETGLRSHHYKKHTDVPRKKKHQCATCGKVFKIRRTLQNHLLIHTGEKPFPCHICGRAFRQKPAMDKHMVLIHKLHKTKPC